MKCSSDYSLVTFDTREAICIDEHMHLAGQPTSWAVHRLSSWRRHARQAAHLKLPPDARPPPANEAIVGTAIETVSAKKIAPQDECGAKVFL
jgi:hypothetical protein